MPAKKITQRAASVHKPSVYRCTCCGEEMAASQFPKNQSPRYAGWNGHISTCRQCLGDEYLGYLKKYNDDYKKAIRRICEKYDYYYDSKLADLVKSLTDEDVKVISLYCSKLSLIQYKDKTYDTTLDKNIDNIERKREIETAVDTFIGDSDDEKKKIKITKSIAERWGIGMFSIDDYAILEDHYQMLKKYNPNCDSNQEIFIRSLCQLNLLQLKALKRQDTKEYISINSEYAKTFKQAGLKTITDNEQNENDCWGVWMKQIEEYTPAECYKDKTLYKDFDGIGSLFKRHVLRPLKNILLKTNERDPEYNVEDDA